MRRIFGIISIVLSTLLLAATLATWHWTTSGSVGESVRLSGDLKFRVLPLGIGIDRLTPVPTAIGQREHAEYAGPFFRADPVVRVPYYLASLIAAALPVGLTLLHVRRLGLRASRRRSGLCVQCGYNVAFTPDRCPECGTVPEAGRTG